ncbi:unnamed protein product [Clavelina lepadiformis]|uniref:Uncharacterized protein n=1 Tax=Clavelina lepadiformis TaxID=159417 RepID=A0ABP0GRI3_CLALP
MPIEMNNTNSTESEPYIRWKHADWLIAEVINSLLILSTLWIIFSLIHFGIKHKKWSKNQTGNADKLTGGIVYTLTVVCAILALVRFIVDQFAFNIGIGIGFDKECEVLADAVLVLYFLVISAVYAFLWLRQRIFYANNMLFVNVGIFLKVLSSSSYVILFLAGLAGLLLTTIPVNHPSSPEGCVYVESEEIGPVAWMIFLVVLVAGQTTLVGLFIYPLKRDFIQSIRGCCPSLFHSGNTDKTRSCSVATIQTSKNEDETSTKNTTITKSKKESKIKSSKTQMLFSPLLSEDSLKRVEKKSENTRTSDVVRSG